VTPDLHTTASRLGVIGALCLIQVAGSAVAAIAVWAHVESIVFIGPALAVVGYVIAAIAIRNLSRRLLHYGLWHPLVTAAFALAIAGFELGPADARVPARVLFGVNLVVVGAWCKALFTGPDSDRHRRPATARGMGFRFSLRAALITTTVLCVVLAFAVSLTWQREWPYFTLYSLLMFALASLYLYAGRLARPT
jgi:hypothetical protein